MGSGRGDAESNLRDDSHGIGLLGRGRPGPGMKMHDHAAPALECVPEPYMAVHLPAVADLRLDASCDSLKARNLQLKPLPHLDTDPGYACTIRGQPGNPDRKPDTAEENRALDGLILEVAL